MVCLSMEDLEGGRLRQKKEVKCSNEGQEIAERKLG